MSHKILGVGELLWDLLPSGPQMGGAPANFTCHARALGADASLVTRVGDDSLGRDLRARCQEKGIVGAAWQTDDSAPTGAVTVALAADGIPHFTIHENVAWDNLAVTPEALCAVRAADAACFGTLAQRREPSRSTIQALMAEAAPQALRIFDINLRQHFFSSEVIERSLGLANVVKLNDGELEIIAPMLGLKGSVRGQIECLARDFGLDVVALTRGPAGSLLFQNGRWSECAPAPVKIADTVGAGDAFTAALALGLLQNMDLDRVNFVANETARFVCSQPGATPPLPPDLVGLFASPAV